MTLDLKDVKYVDSAGLTLISELKSRNVGLVRETPLLAGLLHAHETQRSSRGTCS
jgi:hypothetical protein